MSDIVELLKSRKSENFEGECHLTNEEADAIIAELSTAYHRGREDMRRECVSACIHEYLDDDTQTEEDMAYDRAVADCLAAIRKLEA